MQSLLRNHNDTSRPGSVVGMHICSAIMSIHHNIKTTAQTQNYGNAYTVSALTRFALHALQQAIFCAKIRSATKSMAYTLTM